MPTDYQHPETIVSSEWLAEHLHDPEIRVFECTTYLDYLPPARWLFRRRAPKPLRLQAASIARGLRLGQCSSYHRTKSSSAATSVNR